MNFNIYNSLILAGVIQGIIFAIIVLSSKKYRSTSTYFLIGLILCCVYSNLQYYLTDSKILTSIQMYSSVFLPIAALSPVLLYYYISKFLYPLDKLTFKEKLLLVPFLFFTVTIIPYKIAVAINYQNDNFYYFFGRYANLYEFFSILLMLILLIFSFKKILSYEKVHQSYEGNKIKHQLSWLKKTLILLFILTIIWITLMTRVIIISNHTQSFYLLWISITFLTYWLGHIGVYKYGVAEERKKIRSYFKNHITNITPTKQKNNHIKDLEKLLVDKKQFLNSTLTLDEIASQLNLSKSHLSRIINSELNTSFTGYLNSLRVEKAKEFIEKSKFQNYTLVAIGLEAGFNSKSTFNKAFKEITGFTPSEYKKQSN